MLASELSESLRRNLLWERQQKNLTRNAMLKRRHTTHDLVRLQQDEAQANAAVAAAGGGTSRLGSASASRQPALSSSSRDVGYRDKAAEFDMHDAVW